jgi:hypothetical protein
MNMKLFRNLALAVVMLLATALCAQVTIAGPVKVSGNASIGGQPGGSTVAFDNVAHGSNSSATTSIPSFNLTIGSISNGAVVVALDFSVNTVSAVSVTIGGTSATLIGGTDSTTNGHAYRTMMFGLATASTTGAQAIVVSWTGAANATAGAISFSGVNQSTPFAHGTFTFGQDNGSGGNDPSITITSASGDATMDNVSDEAGADATAPTQTSRYSFRDGAFSIGATGSTAAGAATVTHAWTVGAFATWEQCGVDIVHH